ncbi:hypothetical protein [Isoptericola sp. NPDC055881]
MNAAAQAVEAELAALRERISAHGGRSTRQEKRLRRRMRARLVLARRGVTA